MVRTSIGVLLAVIWWTGAVARPAETAILPPDLPWDGKSRELALDPSHEWATPCEKSGLERTPRYAETIGWLRRLVDAAPQLQMISLGKSAEGRDIWMVVASREGAADPAALAKIGRPTLLAQALAARRAGALPRQLAEYFPHTMGRSDPPVDYPEMG